LDAGLEADRKQQIEAQVRHTVDAEEVRTKTTQTTWAAGVGSFILCFAGPIGGPATLGYALWLHQRARQLEIGWPPGLRLLYGFAGLWSITGAIFWAWILLGRTAW
jgi:hypothetical protein